MAALARADDDLARAWRIAGSPPLRKRPGGFPALLQTIVGQQLSVASARAIWNRLAAAVGPLTPEGVLALDDESCRAIGLSRQKTRYIRDLALAVRTGALDFAVLPRMTDAEVQGAMTAVRGIGPWTAQMYLLFALRRADVWPVDDLAVVEAVRRLKGLETRPGRREMEALAEPWRPWRSAAALFLWHFYNKVSPGEWS